LLEIVTEPDMHSSDEAVAYAKELHKIVTWIGICDGNMQEGSFRCDANVSVRKPGQPLGTRREIKNLNSFKFMQQAIDYEIRWQIEELEDGRAITQATVLFDPDTGETRAMRTKEDAADYRYFPDPDLPPLAIAREWVESVRQRMPMMPTAAAEQLRSEFFLTPYEARFATRDLATYLYVRELMANLRVPDLAPYRNQFIKYDERRYSADFVQNEVAQFELFRLGIAWTMNEVARRLNEVDAGFERSPVSAGALAALILRVGDGMISNSAARQVFDVLWAGAELKALAGPDLPTPLHQSYVERALEDIDRIIGEKGLKQMNDTGALEKIVDDVIAANADNVAQFKAGKDKAFNALVGQVMKASKGKANPAQVNELLRRKLA
jgi:aspartyl-tRNA(Asn)/glutamyl-tRNA(Gln) amidotransferase subunit B